MLGGDKLIAEQKPNGKWIFRKERQLHLGRHLHALDVHALDPRLLADQGRDAARPSRQVGEALINGFEGIAKEEMDKRLANIPCMTRWACTSPGNYSIAPTGARRRPRTSTGRGLPEPRRLLVRARRPRRHVQPGLSRRPGHLLRDVQGQVRRCPPSSAAKFHIAMTYPDGTAVETVDERNVYENTVVHAQRRLHLFPRRPRLPQAPVRAPQGTTKSVIGADMAASLDPLRRERRDPLPPRRSRRRSCMPPTTTP